MITYSTHSRKQKQKALIRAIGMAAGPPGAFLAGVFGTKYGIDSHFRGKKKRRRSQSGAYNIDQPNKKSFYLKQDLDSNQKTAKMPRKYKRKRGKSRVRTKKRVYKKRKRSYSKKAGPYARKALTMLMAPMTTKEYVEGNVYNCGSNGEEYLIPLGSMRSSFDYGTAKNSTGQNGTTLINDALNSTHNYIMFSNIKAQVNNQSNTQAWVRPVYIMAKDRFMDRDFTTVNRFQPTSVLFDRIAQSLKDHYDGSDDSTVALFQSDTYNHSWLCHRPGFKPLSGVGVGRLFNIKFGKWARLISGEERIYTMKNNSQRKIENILDTATGSNQDCPILKGTGFLLLEVKSQVIGTSEADAGADEDDKISTGQTQIAVVSTVKHGYKSLSFSTSERDFEDFRGDISITNTEFMDQEDHQATSKLEV